MYNVKWKKLKPNAVLPTKGSSDAAGYDLYACIDSPITIAPGEMVKIGTGIAVTPPTINKIPVKVDNPLSEFPVKMAELDEPIKTFGAIVSRSGLATKKGLRLANCIGVADIDYTGEYIVALINDSQETQTIAPGERIAQLVFILYISPDWTEVKALEDTERGANGFGSTGV